MSVEVRGSKPVGQWADLLKDEHSDVQRRLNALYGGDRALVKRAATTCLAAVEGFQDAYGDQADVIVARSTGRVNLLGMHIDHRGGSVNPIAIRELFMVAEARDDDVLVLANVEAREFPQETFRIRDCLPSSKIADWDSWCHDEFERRKHDPAVSWSNYVRAPVLYLQHLHTRDDGTFDPPLKGMNVMIHGNVPRAAGQSSSSSIVVAAADACIRINDLKVDSTEFIDICGYGEWYVGTRGGSGDHAAIKFGEPNAILHITAFPLSVASMPFPRGYRIVLADSLVEATKRVGARDVFNNRVASYNLGLMIVRNNFSQHAPKLIHLRDMNPIILGVEEVEIYRMIMSLPESATRQEVLDLLPRQEREVRHIFRSHSEPPEGYKIRQICMYGVAECIRADMAVERLRAGDVAGFGELISISHDGDRQTKIVDGRRVRADNSYPDERIECLIEDLGSADQGRVDRARLWRQPGGYDVSVPEIDILVDIALDTPGVVGAGLVGAGLGGSMLAVVEAKRAHELVQDMARGYYRPRSLPVRAEIVVPVGGAGILDT